MSTFLHVMEWTTFITSVLVLYGLWYVGNFLKDLIFSKNIVKVSEGGTHYDIGDFLNDSPTEVDDPDFITPPNGGPAQEVAQRVETTSESQKVTFDSPPAGQGIPLSEFLKNAKMKAESSAQKIQFT